MTKKKQPAATEPELPPFGDQDEADQEDRRLAALAEHEDRPAGAVEVRDQFPDEVRFDQNLSYGELKALNHGEEPPPLQIPYAEEDESEAGAALRGRMQLLGSAGIRGGSADQDMRAMLPRRENVAPGGGAPLGAAPKSAADPIGQLLNTAHVLKLQADALQLLAGQLLRDVEALD